MKNKVTVNCSYCDKEINILLSRYKKSKTKNFYCDIICKNSWQRNRSLPREVIEKISSSTSGMKNSNYKDGHTYKKSYCKCGKEKDWRANQCNNCYVRQTFKGKHHKVESKLKIGKKSKEKFTREFKRDFRRKMEANGLWLPINEVEDYHFYFSKCDWIDHMFNLPLEGKELLIENGVFDGIKNPYGVVRDHKLSRKTGFDLKIFPEILRHPCNCEVLKNADNISKGKKNSISLEELFKKIINYRQQWVEQEQCIYLINKYEKGYRYERSNYE